DGGVPAGRLPDRSDVSSRRERPDETSAVDVSGQHPCRAAAGVCAVQIAHRPYACRQEWDLVKRCDLPGKVLIQLESLILAQSERWRQAKHMQVEGPGEP